ncbi:MAG TPA: hypothetical protein VJJ47_01575 [Candidatus Paceibacterota bacterium]
MSTMWLATEFSADNVPDGSVLVRSASVAGTAKVWLQDAIIHHTVRLFRESDRRLVEALKLTAPAVEAARNEPEAAIGDEIVVCPMPGDCPDWQRRVAFFEVKAARFIHLTSGGKRVACVDDLPMC